MHRLRLSVGLALTASLLAAGLIAAPPAAAAPKCFGKAATIVGTGGSDVLIGTGSSDVILGLGGQDVLVGRGGGDRLCGGKGADELDGGPAKDRISGGPGGDVIWGLAGKDTLLGGGGNDDILGGGKADVVKGGKGDDFLFGEGGNDTLRGGAGFDVLFGEQGNDLLDGNGDEDLVSFWFSTAAAGINANLATGVATGEGTDTLKNVEGLEASGQVVAADVFTGDAGHNFFFPYEGNDLVAGGGGEDLLILAFAFNPVVVDLMAQTATGEGSDALTSIEMATGSFDFGDSLTGSDVSNWLFGLDGDDSIAALGGNDVLFGGVGEDTGDGGEGTDECLDIEIDTNCELPAPTAAAAPEGFGDHIPTVLSAARAAGLPSTR